MCSMRGLIAGLVELLCWLEAGFLLALLGLALAFAFDLLGLRELRWLAAQPWDKLILYIAAGLALIAAWHFFTLIGRLRRLRRMVRQETRDGPVRISARALQQLITETLGQTELERARVRLVPRRRGVDILVELRGVQPDLVGMAERVQRLLRQEVEFRAGIRVRRIEVRTLNLRRRNRRKPKERAKEKREQEKEQEQGA